jgi:hypothetical protein
MISRIFENLFATVLAALLLPGIFFVFNAWQEREPGPFVYFNRAHFDAKAAPENAFQISTPGSVVTTDQAHADILTFKNISSKTIKDFRVNIDLLDQDNTRSGNSVFRIWHAINDRSRKTIVKFHNDGDDKFYEDLKNSDVLSTGRVRIIFENLGPGAKFDLFIYSSNHKKIEYITVNENAVIYDCCDDGSLPIFVINNWLLISAFFFALIAIFAIARLFWLNYNTTLVPKIRMLNSSVRKID